MKNIWIINHYARPYQGRHFKFAEKLIQRGYDVTVFAASSSYSKGQELINNKKEIYKYTVLNKVPFLFIKTSEYEGNGIQRIKNMVEFAWRLSRYKLKSKSDYPDVIIGSSVHPLTWSAAYKLSKRYDSKFIAETRDLWPETLIAMKRIKRKSVVAKLLYGLESFIYKKADSLIFTMPGGEDYIADRGIKAKNIININNGVDLKEYNSMKLTYKYHDEILEDKDKFKVVYTGSIGIANALIYVVKTARVIKEMGYTDIVFVLYGDGYQRKELEDYVRKNNVDNIYIRGKVDKKYIPYLLSKSNLNIFTGQNIYLYQYGISLNKLFDYLASGVPTLSNIQCNYDVLEKYKCGITVNSGSIEKLVEGLLYFYNMPNDKYEKYSKNALRAANDYDFNNLTDKLEEAIKL